mmetsp:Transcript_101289/g.182833  ORF Transcript_101289/g.182833 Transcript_101289/m.182833 type:complete len:431 (+) Transcript_101289:150-1442(+)|eukprot:CAMPEP_0115058790 /NCGR_PEP_ID=MMETSP0227-20121206/6551_1 /TAXON_ID=89957 /ORGANISM="Polarella glacialis, Strain CCMP 1383" /LENGTH=430 /DNA_ID=CAMNT_0002443827 /DNA_START=95 /DNA_END=1387 /DNA_ORIENTATION=+
MGRGRTLKLPPKHEQKRLGQALRNWIQGAGGAAESQESTMQESDTETQEEHALSCLGTDSPMHGAEECAQELPEEYQGSGEGLGVSILKQTPLMNSIGSTRNLEDETLIALFQCGTAARPNPASTNGTQQLMLPIELLFMMKATDCFTHMPLFYQPQVTNPQVDSGQSTKRSSHSLQTLSPQGNNKTRRTMTPDSCSPRHVPNPWQHRPQQAQNEERAKELHDSFSLALVPVPEVMTDSSNGSRGFAGLQLQSPPIMDETTTYSAIWTPENRTQAERAVGDFMHIANQAFSGGRARSIKFNFTRTVTSAVEVAVRLQGFLGKHAAAVPVEMLAKPGSWVTPDPSKIFVTTHGTERLVVFHIHMPRHSSARGNVVASVQVDERKGAKGARPVTVQGVKAVFEGFHTNYVMCLGAVDLVRHDEGHLKVEAFL